MSKSFVPKAFETACGAAVATIVLFFATAPQSAQGAAKWIIGGNGCAIHIDGGTCTSKTKGKGCTSITVNSCDKAANKQSASQRTETPHAPTVIATDPA